MPRNSQGLYTLPAGNPVVPNTLIESVWANSTMDDMAVALTASLPRDGSAPMTGDLTLAAGDPETSRSAVSKAYMQSFLAYATGMPLAAVLPMAGSVVPPGFLECNGQAVSRTTFADLFTAVGTTYGPGDSATTFNVPDMRDQFIRGKSDARAVGSTQAGSFGSHTHIISDPTHAHAASQPAHSHSVTTDAHTHGVSDPGHSHSIPAYVAGQFDGGGGPNPLATGSGLTTGGAGTGIGIQAAAPTGSTNSQQPAVTVNGSATGISLGTAGGTETVPQNVAMIYVIKAENDSAGPVPVTGIDTSDAQMISVDNTNPVVPELVIHSNVAFGTVKLDGGGKIPLNQMPTTNQQFLGYFDASGGQNPTEKYPTQTFFGGDTYVISVAGSITVFDPVTLVASLTPVTEGNLLQYVTGSVSNPTGWYYAIQSTTVIASQVGFTPAGSIGATNVQDAIVELDGDVTTNSNDIFDLQGDYNSLVAADAGLQSQITDNADAIAGLSAPAASAVSFVPFGTIVATNVQNALQELDGDKVAVAAPVMSGTLNMGAGAKTNYGGTTGVLQVGGVDALEINQTDKTIKGINGYLMAGNGPAFHTRFTGTTVLAATNVKMGLNSKTFDTNSAVNTTTGRFQPTVAGYYQLNAAIQCPESVSGMSITIGKTADIVSASAFGINDIGTFHGISTSGVTYMNGTTDYADVTAYLASGSGTMTGTFSGCLVRAA